jgi:hypothetical protein
MRDPHSRHVRHPTNLWLLFREMQQPIARSVYKRVSMGSATPVKCEDNPTFIAIVLFPPTAVGDGLVGIFIKAMVEVVIGDRHSQPVFARLVREPPRHRPRSQYAVFLEAQIEMRPRFAVVMQDERRMTLRVRACICLGPSIRFGAHVSPWAAARYPQSWRHQPTYRRAPRTSSSSRSSARR